MSRDPDRKRDKDERAHPAPERDRVATHEALFAVWGGAIAWIIQLSASFAFVSPACFRLGERLPLDWDNRIWPLIIGLVCLAVAIGALWLSSVLLRRTREETGGDHHYLFETGHGRTRFMALWGLFFSAIFTTLILINILLLLGLTGCGA